MEKIKIFKKAKYLLNQASAKFILAKPAQNTVNKVNKTKAGKKLAKIKFVRDFEGAMAKYADMYFKPSVCRVALYGTLAVTGAIGVDALLAAVAPHVAHAAEADASTLDQDTVTTESTTNENSDGTYNTDVDNNGTVDTESVKSDTTPTTETLTSEEKSQADNTSDESAQASKEDDTTTKDTSSTETTTKSEDTKSSDADNTTQEKDTTSQKDNTETQKDDTKTNAGTKTDTKDFDKTAVPTKHTSIDKMTEKYSNLSEKDLEDSLVHDYKEVEKVNDNTYVVTTDIKSDEKAVIYVNKNGDSFILTNGTDEITGKTAGDGLSSSEMAAAIGNLNKEHPEVFKDVKNVVPVAYDDNGTTGLDTDGDGIADLWVKCEDGKTFTIVGDGIDGVYETTVGSYTKTLDPKTTDVMKPTEPTPEDTTPKPDDTTPEKTTPKPEETTPEKTTPKPEETTPKKTTPIPDTTPKVVEKLGGESVGQAFVSQGENIIYETRKAMQNTVDKISYSRKAKEVQGTLADETFENAKLDDISKNIALLMAAKKYALEYEAYMNEAYNYSYSKKVR